MILFPPERVSKLEVQNVSSCGPMGQRSLVLRFTKDGVRMNGRVKPAVVHARTLVLTTATQQRGCHASIVRDEAYQSQISEVVPHSELEGLIGSIKL